MTASTQELHGCKTVPDIIPCGWLFSRERLGSEDIGSGKNPSNRSGHDERSCSPHARDANPNTSRQRRVSHSTDPDQFLDQRCLRRISVDWTKTFSMTKFEEEIRTASERPRRHGRRALMTTKKRKKKRKNSTKGRASSPRERRRHRPRTQTYSPESPDEVERMLNKSGTSTRCLNPKSQTEAGRRSLGKIMKS